MTHDLLQMVRTVHVPSAGNAATNTAVAAGAGVDRPAADDRQPSVLLLSTGLQVGGAERVVLDLARAYVDRSVPTMVVALANDRQLLDQIDTCGINISFLGMRKTPAGLVSAARTLARLIRSAGIDIVHAHMPHAALVASATRLLHGVSVPIVHTSHSSRFNPTLALPLRLTRRLRDVDVLFTPSQHEALNTARTVVIPNGIRLPAPATTASRANRAGPVLIFVGRLTDEKNPAALVNAFAALHRSGSAPGAVLKIVGDGPLRHDIARQVARLGLTDTVSLLGLRSDVADLLADADLFVMSSRFEGLPLAVLEAGAAGVPVIAPPVGALPWLLADQCGFLAHPEQLAKTMAEVLANRTEAGHRAAKLRARILERYSLDRAVADHLLLYRQLVAGK